MEALADIKRSIEETIEKKLSEAISKEIKYPVPLIDHILIKRKKIKIYLEIYDDTVIASLAVDKDIFAEGETIKRAKINMRKSLLDEYDFLNRHGEELSIELKEKLFTLQGIVA